MTYTKPTPDELAARRRARALRDAASIRASLAARASARTETTAVVPTVLLAGGPPTAAVPRPAAPDDPDSLARWIADRARAASTAAALTASARGLPTPDVTDLSPREVAALSQIIRRGRVRRAMAAVAR